MDKGANIELKVTLCMRASLTTFQFCLTAIFRECNGYNFSQLVWASRQRVTQSYHESHTK